MKVLVLDPVHEAGLAMLRARQEIELVYLPEPRDAEISHHLRDTQALLLRARRISRQDFDAAGELRLVSRHGVGCDNLDLPYLSARGVGVAVAADANLVSVAEHAFALLLAAAKNLRAADRAVRGGAFAERGAMGARDLAGATVLTVGFGRVGRAFARRAAAFDMHVLVFDPFLPPDAALEAGGERAATLSDGLARADAVSLHLPLTADTAHLFDERAFAAMQKGALLVNTARGGIVDERALLSALDRGAPLRYATDVFADEPPAADDPLLLREDVILSPHSAAMTAEGVQRMATGAAGNILAYLDGVLEPRMVVLPPPYRA